MDYTARKQQLLAELRQYTDLRIEISEDGQDDERVLSVLEAFLEPYRKQADLSSFWLSFLLDELSEQEVMRGMRLYHLRETAAAAVFLLYFPQGYDETVMEILSGLSGGSDRLLNLDETHLLLLRLPRGVLSIENLRETALTMADTLSADAMIPVHISYDSCVEELSALPQSFRNAKLAETCGLLFSSAEHIHPYHELGLGKLVSKLSIDDCREYLADHLGNFRFDTLDAELSATVHAFFDAGLSIAETARNLFIHRNTLVYRLDKFEKLSGLDLRNFDDAVTAKLAMLMEVYCSEAASRV